MKKLDGIEPFLTLPTADPLVASFAVDGIEGDLKQLVTDIFDQELARQLFDANVLGAPHLGTFDLVRRNINADGLVLLPNSSEEEATRYLYRAWRSRDNDGRGVHFLKTYLQMLFPNLCDVEQMMQSKYKPYPTDLYPASTHGGDSDKFLTSRIEITLDWASEVTNFHKLMSVFRSVIPARLTPLFKIRLTILLLIEALFESSLLMQKHIDMDANPCGFKITNKKGIKWTIARDTEFTRLGFEPFVVGRIIGQTTIKLPFYGSDFELKVDNNWRLSQKIGGKLSPAIPKLDGNWSLGTKAFPKDYNPDFTPVIRHCKIASDLLLQKVMEGRVYRSYYLDELNLKLNGQWKVGGRIVGISKLISKSEVDSKPEIDSLFQENIRIDYPFTPPKLGGFAQLGTWRKLDASWRIGGIVSHKPFGFKLQNQFIHADATANLVSDFNLNVNRGKFKLLSNNTLHGQDLSDLWDKNFRLDGSWSIGGTKWTTESETVVNSRAFIYAIQSVDVSNSSSFDIDYVQNTKLARTSKLNSWTRLSDLKIGGYSNSVGFGFSMRNHTIAIDTEKTVTKNAVCYSNLGRFKLLFDETIDSNELWQREFRLDGSWSIGGINWGVDAPIAVESSSIIDVTQDITLTQSNHFDVIYQGRTRLGRHVKLNSWHQLNGQWKVGGVDEPRPFGFKLYGNDSISVDYDSSIYSEGNTIAYGEYTKLGRTATLSGDSKLNGSWQVGGADQYYKLTVNGGWQLGQRGQVAYSSMRMMSFYSFDVAQFAESSIVISGGDSFSFYDAAGDLQNYTLYTTEKIEIIDNKIALNVKPYGDIFLGTGEVTRNVIDDIEIVEDHDKVTAIEVNGDYFAQFDPNSTDINGLFGVVTYLAMQ